MDINFIRIAAMLLGLACFTWLVLWTWSRKRREQFEAAARLPFQETDVQGSKGEAR